MDNLLFGSFDDSNGTRGEWIGFDAPPSLGPTADTARISPERGILREMLGLIAEPVLLTAIPGLQVLDSSPGARRFFGAMAGDLANRNLFSLVAGGALGPHGRAIARFVASNQCEAAFRITCRREHGSELPIELSLRRLENARELMLVVARNLSPSARDSGAIGLVAMLDPLTNLPNRLEWEERLAAAVERARTGPGRMLAVLFIDLDDFKRINDSYGHQVGDHVLRAVAQRLVASVRPADLVTRYGGDEFVVLLDDVPSLRQVRRVARRICRAIKIPMECDANRLLVSASVGVKIGVEGKDSAPELIAAADLAMYRAKALGRQSGQSHPWILHPARSA